MMYEWIFVLRLLGADVETGEVEWHEAISVPNLSFEACVQNVVEAENTLDEANIQHEVYCEQMAVKKDDK